MQACFVHGLSSLVGLCIWCSLPRVLSDDKESEYESPQWEMVNLDSNVGPTTHGGDVQTRGTYVTPALSDDSRHTHKHKRYKWPVGETRSASRMPTALTRTQNDDSLAGYTTGSWPGIWSSSTFSNDLGHTPDDWHADESVRRTPIPRVVSKQSLAADTIAATPVSYDDQETQYVRSNALPPTNVIVFGESGVGKSSIINMLVGEPVATVSNQAAGCTFASTKFRATINDREVILYDTAGLDEADAGTVSPEQAIQNLRSLVTELTTVNLLVYVIRGTRFRKIVSDNYHMFRAMIHGGDCDVPVVLVITGLENEENMDDWWEDNKAYLAQYKLTFRGHACVTATKGRAFRDGSGYIFEDLYDASRKKVVNLLAEHAFNTSVTIAPLPKDSIFRRWWSSLLSELYQVGGVLF